MYGKKIEPILDRIRKKIGVRKDTEMCERLGIKYGTLDNWKNRDKIPERRLKEIADKIGVTYEWLESGESGMPFVGEQPIQYGNSNRISIPVVSETASAGTGSNIESVDVFDTDRRLTLDLSLFKTPPKGKLHVIEVDGYSMVPVLLPSSWVIFEESKMWSGDGLYVLVFRGVLMVKQVEADPKTGNLWIKSANPQYESWEYDPTDDQSTMRIVGRVLRCVI